MRRKLQGAALGIKNHHGQHILLLHALQNGRKEGGRVARGGLALCQLPQSHGSQHSRVAIDDRLADLLAQRGAEANDHRGANSHQQRSRQQHRQHGAIESRVHSAAKRGLEHPG